MNCYNDCGKEAIEGKYYCSKECKVADVEKRYGKNSPTRLIPLTVPEMRAKLREWSKDRKVVR